VAVISAFAVSACGATLATGSPATTPSAGTTSSQLPSVSPWYTAAHGIFDVAGPMLIPGLGAQTATTLSDGRVLLVGGSGPDNVAVAAAEILDPASGTFSATGSMQHAREGHSAALLNDGRVLVVGGDGRSAELYDPVTATFSATGPLLGFADDASATTLPDGKVLIAGGLIDLRAEIYDPASGLFSWTGPTRTRAAGRTATSLADGKVLLAGGYVNLAGATGPLTVFASAEVYDPTIGAFTAVGPMNQAREGATATVLSDGRVLVAGGRDSPTVCSRRPSYSIPQQADSSPLVRSPTRAPTPPPRSCPEAKSLWREGTHWVPQDRPTLERRPRSTTRRPERFR
jgi:hypothetical protein